MKRFFCKCGLLFIIAVVLVLVFNALYLRTNYWKSENNMNRFVDIPYNLELGNVGSSHTTYGIDWRAVPEIRAWNLALSSQPYFYDHAVLKNYIDHFSENAVVVICLSYFEIDRVPDYAPYRARYYRILPKDDLDSWSRKEDIVYRLVPFLSAGNNTIKIVHDIPPEQMSPYFNRGSYLEGNELYDYCVNKHESWTTHPRPTTPQEDYAQNLEQVSAIIELCHAHRLRPVLITTPITDVLNAIYDEKTPEFFTTFRQFSADLCERYPDVPYFDYSHDETFSARHELFTDGDHLNNAGASLFTKTLVADLRRTGILAEAE